VRIAQVAPPFESIPPVAYGGTERVVATLCDELVRRGHDVTLFAAGDSHTSARLVPTVEKALWHYEPSLNDFNPFWALTLDAIWEHVTEFDVIHSHFDYWGYILAHHAPVPVVTTLHGRLDLPELQPLYRHFKDVPLVSISDAQRRPVWWANFISTVYHGIELDQFTFSPQPSDYLAFLGRISPEKGLDAAIRIAHRAGVPLKVAARMPLPHTNDSNVQTDWEYFEEVVRPLLEHDQVEFVGELAGADKDKLLGGAVALLFPISWPEPFGLVLAEALACGTPILALEHGSVPEVIQDGLTGFVCQDEDALVAAVGRIGEICRSTCRAEAERRFSPARMASAYEDVYAQLLSRSAAATLAQTPVPHRPAPRQLAGSNWS
jgi:glycosyltransferase involved in cell wall biosynthesis